MIDFTYDANGVPLTMKVGDSTYYYITNLQGDVMALVDAAGDVVVTYSYTAYGEVTSSCNNDIMELVERGDFSQDVLLMTLRSILLDAGLSGGVFYVDGYKNFDEVTDYAGPFETYSGTVKIAGKNVSGFYSRGDSCQVFGIKVGVSTKKSFWPFSVSYSRTFYKLIEFFK